MPKHTARRSRVRKRNVKRRVTKKRGGMDPPSNSSNRLYDEFYNEGYKPSDYELYDIDDSTPVCDKTRFEKIKKTLSGWFESILNGDNFKKMVVGTEITAHDRALIIQCALELLDVVYTILEGKISMRRIQTIGSACFIISVQLLFGFDNIHDNQIYGYMKYADQSTNPPKDDKIRDFTALIANILEKTGWKGCHTFLLNKNNKNTRNMQSHTSTCGINANGKGCTCRASQKSLHAANNT